MSLLRMTVRFKQGVERLLALMNWGGLTRVLSLLV